MFFCLLFYFILFLCFGFGTFCCHSSGVQPQAANITGGSQPLDSPHPGAKPAFPAWGPMGGMDVAMGAAMAMGGKGWGWDGGKGMWNGWGPGWEGAGKGGYGPQSTPAAQPGPYSGGCAKGGW